MNKFTILLTSIFITAIVIVGSFSVGGNYSLAQNQPGQAAPKQMKITSPAFSQGDKIPVKYTCEGENAIPPLEISGAPAEAKSLAIIVDDPDAPRGNFNHWIIWNIEPNTTRIDGMPAGAVSGKNSGGNTGFVGPCPPMGTHRYYFKVFALDDKINLDTNAIEDDLTSAMNGHIIAQGELMGRYIKQQ